MNDTLKNAPLDASIAVDTAENRFFKVQVKVQVRLQVKVEVEASSHAFVMHFISFLEGKAIGKISPNPLPLSLCCFIWRNVKAKIYRFHEIFNTLNMSCWIVFQHYSLDLSFQNEQHLMILNIFDIFRVSKAHRKNQPKTIPPFPSSKLKEKWDHIALIWSNIKTGERFHREFGLISWILCNFFMLKKSRKLHFCLRKKVIFSICNFSGS